MEVYYGLLEKQGHMTIAEFRAALADYEKKKGKAVYPGLASCQSCEGVCAS